MIRGHVDPKAFGIGQGGWRPVLVNVDVDRLVKVAMIDWICSTVKAIAAVAVARLVTVVKVLELCVVGP
jgi:hypothetical protein